MRKKNNQSVPKLTESTCKYFLKDFDFLFNSIKYFLSKNKHTNKSETHSITASKILRHILFFYFLHSANKNTTTIRELYNKAILNNKNFYKDYLLPLIEDFTDEALKDLYLELPNDLLSAKDGKGILDLFDNFSYSLEENTEDSLTPQIIEDLYQKCLEDANCKTSGTYYTPKKIVKYMCRQSLHYYFKNKESFDSKESLLKNIKIYDPACGSGRFLTGMVNEIVDLLNKEKDKKISDFIIHLIENSLYGSDLDKESVENTKLQLFLILIKHSPLFKLNKFRTLKFNLKTENSILNNKGMEKFDIVIGNPPYVRISSIDKKYDLLIRENYETVFGHYDTYIPFIEHGIKSLNTNGIMAYITPNKYLTKRYANKLRPFILEEVEILELIDTSQTKTFDNAAAYPVISIFSKKKNKTKIKIAILDNSSFHEYFQFQSENNSLVHFLDKDDFIKNTNYTFDIFIDKNTKELFEKISSNSKELGNYSRILTGTPAIKKYYEWKKLFFSETKSEKDNSLKFINVSNIKPYFIEWGKNIRAVGKTFDYPRITYDENLIGKNKWNVFKQKKIVIKGNAKKLTAAFDDEGFANLSLYAVMFNEEHNDEIKTLYHLGLLNSKLLNYWYCKKFASSNLSGNYISFNGIYLNQLPIKDASGKQKNEIAKTAKDILTFTSDTEYLQNKAKQLKVNLLQHEMDNLIYKLYGLSKDDIELIENEIENPG